MWLLVERIMVFSRKFLPQMFSASEAKTGASKGMSKIINESHKEKVWSVLRYSFATFSYNSSCVTKPETDWANCAK